jgi:hypothetical protein
VARGIVRTHNNQEYRGRPGRLRATPAAPKQRAADSFSNTATR